MSGPELRDWTIVRFSSATHSRVVQFIAATGHVFNRAHAYDGQLLMTTKLEEISLASHWLRTMNTVYRLSGPSCPMEAWDAERYDWTWRAANFDQCLTEMTDVNSIPDRFYHEIRDSETIRLHETQSCLLNIISVATDIDSDFNLRHSTDISRLAALGVIATRTTDIGRALGLVQMGQKKLIEEFGGLTPVGHCPEISPWLVLSNEGERCVATRLIPYANTAGTVTAVLPEKLGPWARSTWFVTANPNLLDYSSPISCVEIGYLDRALRAAAAFPKIDRGLY